MCTLFTVHCLLYTVYTVRCDDITNVAEPVKAEAREERLKFAVASVGVKLARGLFRLPSKDRASGGDAFDVGRPELATKALWEQCEVFARDQRAADPSSARGYWNLAWCAHQKVHIQPEYDGLSAAADFLDLMTQCYEVADAESDDFMRCAGRIEACMGLVLGGAGFVGLTGTGGQVRRREEECDECVRLIGIVIGILSKKK